MKTTKLIGTLTLAFLLGVQLHAQVTLPYFSGFDNSQQQNGWTEYKTAATQFSHWGYDNFNAFSAPSCIGHSYSPSTGITLTDNWYVSPGFEIPTGGKLDSIRYKFSGFSVPDMGDTIAVYLLNGASDPATAVSKTLLFDFRGNEYMTDNTYRIKTDINLPPASGLNYLAIRYRNTDCSSKWLTVYFDNIAISGGTVGLDKLNMDQQLSVYPNPANDGKFYLNYSSKIQSVEVLNSLGQLLQSVSIPDPSTEKLEIDLGNQPKGIYFIVIQGDGEHFTKKIVFQ